MDQKVESQNLYLAFARMKEKDFEEAQTLLDAGLKEAKVQRDLTLEGLYYSAFGVLYKLKNEFRTAWNYYSKAEKILPEDPSLKLISSRLLLEYFSQYETVVRKIEKLIPRLKAEPPLLHQAYTLLGLAYLGMGKKDKVKECLEKSKLQDFKSLVYGVNLDFDLVKALMKKKLFRDECLDYFRLALQFVTQNKEKPLQNAIQNIIENY